MYTNYTHIDVYIVFVHLDLLKIPFFSVACYSSQTRMGKVTYSTTAQVVKTPWRISRYRLFIYFFFFFLPGSQAVREHSKDLFLKASSKSPASLIQSA